MCVHLECKSFKPSSWIIKDEDHSGEDSEKN